MLAPEAARGFRLLGMLDVAEPLEKAMEYFGLAYPRERAVREALLSLDTQQRAADPDLFEALDDAFCDALDGDGHRFERLADEYARGRSRGAG